jgi:hypothetical protein
MDRLNKMPQSASWIIVPVLSALFALSGAVGGAGAALAQPDTRGPLSVEEWDAGKVVLDGVEIHVWVYYPAGAAGPMPVAAVVHGASRYAAVMGELSQTLASRGFAALTPNIPCNFAGCDHEANARQTSALLEWGVAQSADPSSKLHGLVDGSRRAVFGHSWGGLAGFLAAKDNPSIGLVIILDANDDKDVGKAAAPLVTQPSIHVMAEKMGPCNSYNWKENIYPLTPLPHMRVVVTGAAHCDTEDPTDGLCKYVCGSGDPSTAFLFRRYAVAWAACIFLGDAAMAPWLEGPEIDADAAAGRIHMVDHAGLASLPCLGGVPDAGATGDGGSAFTDSASADTPVTEDGRVTEDQGTVPADAGDQSDRSDPSDPPDAAALTDTADSPPDADLTPDAGRSDGGASAAGDARLPPASADVAAPSETAPSGCSCTIAGL